MFILPTEFTLDPTEPWQLQLLVQRATGTREKAFLTFDLDYVLPERYLKVEPQAQQPAAGSAATPLPGDAAAAVQNAPGGPGGEADVLGEPLWQRIWRANVVEVALTVIGIVALTGIFFFQNLLVRRPRLYVWVRRGFLAFTLLWLGWYANAQLSVVNVIAFTNALVTHFSWEYFLAAPLVFLLWCSVAAGLLFWGGGRFAAGCARSARSRSSSALPPSASGCHNSKFPGSSRTALAAEVHHLSRAVRTVPLFMSAAEQLAEVEPFKTAIILKFVREWPFILYAGGLLAVGAFIERFFCRYLCPLGAALAIPGRIRMFEWLRRWPECGSPCQRCAKSCPVQAIHPEGHIDVNECIYCMHCQELYWDDQRCPHMIQLRLKRETAPGAEHPGDVPDCYGRGRERGDAGCRGHGSAKKPTTKK